MSDRYRPEREIPYFDGVPPEPKPRNYYEQPPQQQAPMRRSTGKWEKRHMPLWQMALIWMGAVLLIALIF